MLTELRLLNFKSWRDPDPLPLGRLVGLFGNNSSGKSSLLQEILLLQQTSESRDRTQPLEFGGDRAHVRLGSFLEVVYDNSRESVLQLGLTWRPKNRLIVANPETLNTPLFEADTISFDAELAVGRGDIVHVNSLRYDASGNTIEMRRRTSREYAVSAAIHGNSSYLRRAKGRAWPLPAPVKCYGFPDQLNAYFQNASFANELELAFEQQMGDVYYLGPLRSNPRRQYNWAGSQPRDVGDAGQQAIEALLASRIRGRSNHRRVDSIGRAVRRITVEEHIAQWLRQLNLITEFRVEPLAPGSDVFRVRIRRTPGSPLVLLTDVGFGVSQILPVLVLLAYVPDGSTVLLEQPEIHLHPAVQAGLADVLLEAATVRNVQVIVESHSEHLLRRLQRRVAEATANADDCTLYFCDIRKDESVAERLQLNMFGEIENWPGGFFGDPFEETAAIAREGLRRRASMQS